jgi:rare lipoprotein A
MRAGLKAMLGAGAVALLASLPVEEAEAEPVVSSWYGPGFEGALTANGDVYRPGERTAAHRSLPFGTELLVTYGGRKTVVEVTDRGPYVGAATSTSPRGPLKRSG